MPTFLLPNSIKSLKEVENGIHEELYNNVLLLTKVYPTTNEFQQVFKKDMFMKNNKAAFQQVIYYLLNILNADLTKQKITAWPPYDIRLENKFRNEVLKYINELNTIYNTVHIPNLMASHLISPGGFRFVRFMFKLSQLVLVEHLERKTEIFHPITPNKDVKITDEYIRNLKIVTEEIEDETRETVDSFEQFHMKAKIEADSLFEEKAKLGNQIKSATIKKRQIQTDSELNADLSLNLTELENELGNIENLSRLFQRLYDFSQCNELVMRHNENDFKVLDNVQYLINTKSGLDINELLKTLKVFLDNKSLELPNFTTTYLDDLFKWIDSINRKYSHNDKRLNEIIIKLEEFQQLKGQKDTFMASNDFE